MAELFPFTDWPTWKLEEREAHLHATEGGWLNADRKRERGREMAHLIFELEFRYDEERVLEQLKEVVERGAEQGA